uniref:Putative secreted peptide n=1 Tax=Anopheles braziliensis TaxID=58242 RepID=A0A2M3ZXF3_9DIPT
MWFVHVVLLLGGISPSCSISIAPLSLRYPSWGTPIHSGPPPCPHRRWSRRREHTFLFSFPPGVGYEKNAREI